MSSIPVEEIMRVGGFVAGTLVHTREGLQPIGKIKGVGSLFMTRVSGIDTRAVCLAAPALQLEILRIMS